MHIHGRCGAVSIFHAESFENRDYAYTLPQTNRVAIGALAGGFDSEELAIGSQVRDPVLSLESGIEIIDHLDYRACVG